MGKMLRLTAADGHEFDAYLAEPEAMPKAGLVVCQEVFGVNAHMRRVADGFARQGYRVVAPALFDRAERGVELGYTEAELAQGRRLRTALEWEAVVEDVRTAAAEVAAAGRVGVIGYCWGGSVAWLAACRLSPDAAVGYYGGQIHQFRDERPQCPTILHFGERDPIIPIEHVEDIRTLHPEVEVFIYPAGHGFNCDERPDHDAESSRAAEKRTLAFLERHLT